MEDDAGVPDKPEDIAPRFHKARKAHNVCFMQIFMKSIVIFRTQMRTRHGDPRAIWTRSRTMVMMNSVPSGIYVSFCSVGRLNVWRC